MRSPTRKRAFRVLLAVVVPVVGVQLFMELERCNWTTSGGPFARVRGRIERHRVDAGVPSFSVAAAKEGRIVWEESFGWADLEKRVEATPDTMYALASTSKALTATGIMVLAARGLVDLDRPVFDYVGDVGLRAYEGSLADVTLRRIFTHTSGLPRFWCHYYPEELATRPSERELVRRHGALVFPPGERPVYSNLGIALAGMVIEEIAGMSYGDFMKTQVFAPLGLTRTAIVTAPYDDPGIAQKYEGGRRLPFSDMGIRAAGSAWASAHDLVRFGMFHLKDHLPEQEPILGDAALDGMYRSVDPRLPEHNYHLPWIEYRHRGYQVFHFGGHVHGGRVSFRLVPSEDVAVVVMSNGEEGDTPKVADWVLNRLLPGLSWTGVAREVGTRLGRLASAWSGHRDVPAGRWEGEIRTVGGGIPVRLTLEADGAAQLRVGDGAAGDDGQVGSGAHVRDGVLYARFDESVPVDETSRARHRTYLELGVHSDHLGGPAYAESEGFFFCFPYYVRLERGGEAIPPPPPH